MGAWPTHRNAQWQSWLTGQGSLLAIQGTRWGAGDQMWVGWMQVSVSLPVLWISPTPHNKFSKMFKVQYADSLYPWHNVLFLIWFSFSVFCHGSRLLRWWPPGPEGTKCSEHCTTLSQQCHPHWPGLSWKLRNVDIGDHLVEWYCGCP